MDGFSADEEKRAERPAGERRLLNFSAFSKWMFLCHSNKKSSICDYTCSHFKMCLRVACSASSLSFIKIYTAGYISYKRRVSVRTSSESFCIEKCYPSFTKRKKPKVSKPFSVVFQHLCRQQRALAPLFCAKANPLPLEFISLFFF